VSAASCWRGVIGAFGSVAISGDGERIADHSWDVKFILPNNENIFRSIIRLNNHLNKNSIRKHLKSLPAASMRFSRLERI
jgi:S-ribosylhomocysteine lyase LuxS involved in autoinducer biosynthesis